ncbi:MAG: Methyltransferase type 12 [Methanocalculus sp. 52_23]|nr:MAG: Methyltransferase type 12 [Methanocalculus sp. 52_23]
MQLYYKNDIILDLVKNKKVLHIGACDTPYSKERYLKRSLLHSLINAVSGQVIGIDVDRDSIEELRDLGVSNIFFGDIIDDVYDIDLQGYDFDYIIIGDVIEHLDNPGKALQNIKRLMTDHTKVIITVPNCFSYGAIKNIIKKDEEVHPDHVFWTSKKTMERMLKNQGLRVTKFQYCFYGTEEQSRTRKRLGVILFKQFPKFLPCLVFQVYLDTPYSSSASREPS